MVVIQEGQVSVYTLEIKTNKLVHFWTTLDNTAYAVIIDSIYKIYYETHD